MAEDRRQRPSGHHRLPIVDQEALTAVLEALKDERGTQQAAADEIGVDASAYSRLRRGKRGSIEYATYREIAAQLGGTVSDVGKAPRQVRGFPLEEGPPPLVLPSQKEAIRRIAEVNRRYEEMVRKRQAYEDALSAYRTAAEQADAVEPPSRDDESDVESLVLSEAEKRRNELWHKLQRAVLTEEQRFAWGHYQSWMQSEIRRIEDRATPVLDALWEREDYKEVLAGFLSDVGRDPGRLPDGQLDRRCWLALLRALEPLGVREETWRMEYGWRDLHLLDELTTYLNAALRREALLFDPAREMERVRQARAPYTESEGHGMHADGVVPTGEHLAEWLELLDRGADEEGAGEGGGAG